MGANRPLTGLASQTVGPAAADAADAAACANTCFRERAPTDDGGRTGFSAGNDPPFYDLNTLK